MTTAEASRVLDVADGILSGTVTLPRGRGARIAAVLARSALEDVIVDVCARRGVEVGWASMRVKLATLVALSEPRAGELAMAWWGLSRACHQHAYEITPNHNEVAYLVAAVRDQLSDAVMDEVSSR
jgi:hypothetical protein